MLSDNWKPKTPVGKHIVQTVKACLSNVDSLDFDELVAVCNALRILTHRNSPFKEEPVDCVVWIKSECIESNDYNPNVVAPPEMILLERSIREDGYTQPIVSWRNDSRFQVVDGFHRHRVGNESDEIKDRIRGHLPLTVINKGRTDRGDRIASTIRHNRARGKHQVEAMSDIVVELKRRNWSDNRIAKELGMDSDEVLRLCQITGLAEVFCDTEFSKSWDIGSLDDLDDLDEDSVFLEDE